MERWLQERQAYEHQLHARVQRTRSQEDITAWERFARQTARMKVTAEQLRNALPSEFAVVNGVRVLFQGKEIYLEHLVVGPTGIYLIESVEDNPLWRDDLARSIAFFIQNLGSEAGRFACLVIARELGGTDRLPPGAHLVDSLEAALYVVRDTRAQDPLPPAVAQELWQILRAMAPREPMQAVRQAAAPRRFTWREWLTIGAVLGVITLMWAYIPDFGPLGWAVGVVVFVLPAAGVAALTLLIPQGTARTIVSYALMILAVVFFLLAWLGAAVSEG